MTLKEKIGQMFMAGFAGPAPSKGILKLIKDFQLGGVILFRRNLRTPAQAAKLCNALQTRSSKMPLLISIDQEGGRISRLPEGFTIFPGGSRLAACGSTEWVYRVAEATARELRAVGINMNMSPVLDVNTNPANPVIGDRAFSASATRVSTLGLTTVAGLQDNNVVACGKHFPGHGGTGADSHKELPRVLHGLQRLRDVELRPFVHAIQNGLVSIMTAHVLYPALDPDEPATLSRRIVHALLRENLKFKGIVVTDDMEMAAIADSHDTGEAAVKAIEAGVDLVLICHDEEKQFSAIEAVMKAVKKRRISEARIDQSLLRILQVKEKFLLPYRPADPAQIKEIVGSRSHRHLLQELQEKTGSAVLARSN
jgi:beta-N-acetylhexosaminidase